MPLSAAEHKKRFAMQTVDEIQFLDEVEEEEQKSPAENVTIHHLPGKHVQKSHGRGRTKEGGFPPANPSGLDTEEMFRNKDGSWTAERTALHEKIIEEELDKASPVKEPVAYVMGGGPASGKSSVLKSGDVNLPENHIPIDSDAIKAKLPEYQAKLKIKDKSAAAFVHEESSAVSKELQKRASTQGFNTVLDGTGNNDIDKLEKKVSVMRNAGQKVVAHYVTVDTDEAVRRSMKRAERSGRLVPESFIRASHAGVSRVVPQALDRGLYDEFTLWDNNGKTPRKVATAKRGQDVNVLDQTAWNAFLAKGR